MPIFSKVARLLFLLALPLVTHANEIQWDKTVKEISDKVIGQNYQLFATSAQTLSDSSKAFCETPSSSSLTQVQTAFKQNLADWQKVQWLNFGPATLFMRYHSFAYWPDKKGLTQRQLRNLIKGDIASADEEFWRSASIAVRGLTAMESILYRPDFDPINNPSYCQLLIQISQHHQHSIRDIYTEWQTNRFQDWVFIDEGEKVDLSAAVMENMAQQWIEHIAMVKDSKIEQPIGWNTKGNIRLAEFYRSGYTLDAIKQNVQLYHDIYHAGSPSLRDIGLQHAPEKAKQLEAALNANITAVNQLPTGFFTDEFSNDERKVIAKNVIATLSSSQKSLAELISAFGFTIGFNSRDGD